MASRTDRPQVAVGLAINNDAQDDGPMKLPRTKRGQAVLAAVVTAQTVSSALAWRDLSRRTDDQVRGPKNLWRVIVTMNPGNSIAYWLVGRR
jgi:hypothetical protein